MNFFPANVEEFERPGNDGCEEIAKFLIYGLGMHIEREEDVAAIKLLHFATMQNRDALVKALAQTYTALLDSHA